MSKNQYEQEYEENLGYAPDQEVDYEGFYEDYYGDYDEENVRTQILSDNNIYHRVRRYTNERIEDAKDFYNSSVEEHLDYFSDAESTWRQKQQSQRDKRFIKQLLIVVFVISLFFAWIWLMSKM